MPYINREKRAAMIAALMRARGPMGCKQLAAEFKCARSGMQQIISPRIGTHFKLVAPGGNGPYAKEALYDVVDSVRELPEPEPTPAVIETANDVIAQAMRAMIGVTQ
jgi:hypothetical protein